MATQNLKEDVPRVSMDNSMNDSTVSRSSILFRLLQKPDVSLELRNKIPLETANEPRFSQSIRQSKRSGGDAADRREMSPDQTPELPQKTDLDDHHQESSQDELPQRVLQVHPRVRSSLQAGLETVAEFRPKLLRQITSETNYSDSETQRAIPEMPEEYQMWTERSQHDQKTDRDSHYQESSQDVLPRRDLQVHPILRSSPQTGLETVVEFRPELQRQITSETNYSDSETQRAIPEMPEEYQMWTERSQHDQETDRASHYQESSQDVLPRRDLQVHPILRSSPQTGFETAVEFRPELQRQITSETNYSNSETQVIPEAPEEDRVKTERSHQADQKLNRLYYLSVPSGRKALAGERPLKPPDMNVPRPMFRSPLTTPYHFQMPPNYYQLMVSPLAKYRVTGNLSSVYPQDLRNRTDSIKQEVVSHVNLEQPESCCETSAADKKLENERPTRKDSWPPVPRRYSSLTEMEQYLDLWATEPNFVEEVSRIAAAFLQKARWLSAIVQAFHHLQQQGVFSRRDLVPRSSSG